MSFVPFCLMFINDLSSCLLSIPPMGQVTIKGQRRVSTNFNVSLDRILRFNTKVNEIRYLCIKVPI